MQLQVLAERASNIIDVEFCAGPVQEALPIGSQSDSQPRSGVN